MYIFIRAQPDLYLPIHVEKVSNATKCFTDFSLKANVESNTALLA